MSNNLRNYTSLDLGASPHCMSVTAFVGGSYGHGVQFTIGANYCALAENQVRDLISALQRRVKSIKAYQATSYDLNVEVNPIETTE